MQREFGETPVPMNNTLDTLSPRQNQKKYNEFFTVSGPPKIIEEEDQDFEAAFNKESRFGERLFDAETKYNYGIGVLELDTICDQVEVGKIKNKCVSPVHQKATSSSYNQEANPLSHTYNILSFELNEVKVHNREQEISLRFLNNTSKKGISISLKRIGSEEKVVKLISFNDFMAVAIFADIKIQVLDLKISNVNQTIRQLLDVPMRERGVLRFNFEPVNPYIRLLSYANNLGSGTSQDGFPVSIKSRLEQWFPYHPTNLISSRKDFLPPITSPAFPPLEITSQSATEILDINRAVTIHQTLKRESSLFACLDKRSSPRLLNKDFPEGVGGSMGMRLMLWMRIPKSLLRVSEVLIYPHLNHILFLIPRFCSFTRKINPTLSPLLPPNFLASKKRYS